MIFSIAHVMAEVLWLGIEQEFTLIGTANKFTKWPLGWSTNGYSGPQDPYYFSIAANVCFGRIISDMHYRTCLFSGINYSRPNAEVMPG